MLTCNDRRHNCRHGKLGHPHRDRDGNFKYLASLTKILRNNAFLADTGSLRTGRAGVDKTVYPDMQKFFADLARVYREEIRPSLSCGLHLPQIDDVNSAYLCDPKDAGRREKDRRGSE